ncbi:CPBP family intramembrane glutamic endopeptidase [Nocardia huaxiensis]|uniref:CPBP family intramembrane metalloprotease n=1 Tax=Nocardia huaxiensis TaxID=2755382 RepID=A0A7D6V8I7_9NOCA|nr:CPBP family intramembrane glutamic endopeptidase [Nocardia huaxiensis]QLY30181.1 CPBP family intramembrane metalloprotease [Nocardia huaxiensis]UFS96204.1 CPBP family intramembrane metalloprotease [Nocardia huaxiensis]
MDEPRARPLLFLTLVAALSIPLYVLGALSGGLRIGGLTLPSSAAILLLPSAVAVGLTWRDSGGAAVSALLRRVVDRPRAAMRWYLSAVLLMPAIGSVSYLLLRWTGQVESGLPLALLAAPAVIVVFLLASASEELGWTAYATDPLQRRFGALATGLGLGCYWAAWHLVGWSQAGHSAAWIAGWALVTIAARVLIVWLHNRTGHGVTTAILLHATLNIVSAYMPDLDKPVTTITIGVVTAVVATVTLAGSSLPPSFRRYPWRR